MKILLTGGSGFVGKAFIKKYRKNFDIVAPSREQMDLLNARSIEDMFKKHTFDAVVHLAGAGEQSKKSAIEADNLIMFKNIQYMSIVHGVKKLIIVGEGAEFDRSQPIVDYTEECFGKSIPVDGYGLGRYLINLLASKDKITTVLRVFDLYGVGGGKHRINKIVAAGARGKKSIVLDCDRLVSAVSVDDLIKVIAEFLRGSYEKGDYNVVSGEKTSLLQIAKTVKRLVKKDGGDIEINIKSQEPGNEFTADNKKLLDVLPVKFTPTLKGVKKLYEDLKPSRGSSRADGNSEDQGDND